VPLGQGTLSAEDQGRIASFNREAARLQRAALGAGQALTEVENRLRLLAQAIDQTPAAATLRDSARAAVAVGRDLRTEFSGDQTVGSRNEPTSVTILGRVGRVVGSTWTTTTGPTATHRRSLEVAGRQLGDFLPKLRAHSERLRRLEDLAESAGVPWTPGRIPTWRP
jgi:hypothetical protein